MSYTAINASLEDMETLKAFAKRNDDARLRMNAKGRLYIGTGRGLTKAQVFHQLYAWNVAIPWETGKLSPEEAAVATDWIIDVLDHQ